MIREAEVTRFDRLAENGRTKPLRVAVLSADGMEHEVVLKVSAGSECSIEGLTNEMLSSLLAADLGLPVCESFLVSLDRQLIFSIPDSAVRDRLTTSSPVAFGSKHAGNQWRRWLPSDKLAVGQIDRALSVLAFDAFIGNSDRSPRNSNMLVKDQEWRLIDHEGGFGFRLKLFPPCKPWVPGNLELMRRNGEDSEHIFAKQLSRRQERSYAHIRDKWVGLSDARIAQYGAALPKEWKQAHPFFVEALDHLKRVRDQIDLCLREVERVLS